MLRERKKKSDSKWDSNSISECVLELNNVKAYTKDSKSDEYIKILLINILIIPGLIQSQKERTIINSINIEKNFEENKVSFKTRSNVCKTAVIKRPLVL